MKEINRRQARGDLGLEKPKGKSVPFDEFANQWLQTKVLLPIQRAEVGHLSRKSVRSYEQQVRLHLIPFLGSRDVRQFSVGLIESLWDHYIKTGRPPSKRSREIALGTLRQILGHAVARELIPANVVDQWKAVRPRGRASTKTKPVGGVNVLDSEEREHLLDTARRTVPAYFPFILFLAETGCRVSEAIALRWSDVDLAAGIATVYRQKTGGGPDEVALSGRLRSTLRDALPDIAPPGTRAFTTPSRTPILYFNFRRRVWAPIVEATLGRDRRLRFTGYAIPGRRCTSHLVRPSSGSRLRGDGRARSSSSTLMATFCPVRCRGSRTHLDPRTGTDRNRPFAVHKFLPRLSPQVTGLTLETLEPTRGLEPRTC